MSEYEAYAQLFCGQSSVVTLDKDAAKEAAGPGAVCGVLYKRSPAFNTSFQRRNFVLGSGALCYTSGSGEVKALPVIDIDRVEHTCKTKHEFAIRFRAIDRSVTSHEDFIFRADDDSTVRMWIDGFARHIDHERALHATLECPQADTRPSAQSHAPSGRLLKQRSQLPHDWHRIIISCVGSAVLYANEEGGWQKVISLRHAKSIASDNEKLQLEICTERQRHKFRANDEQQFFYWLNHLNYALSHRYSTRTPGDHNVLRRHRMLIAPVSRRLSSLRDSRTQDNSSSWDSHQWEVLNALPILRLKGTSR